MTEVPVSELARKAGVLWVAAPGHRPVACWQIWRNDRSYVLTGPGEQPLPGLAGAATCELTARSADTGGRAGRWTATVAEVPRGGDEWDEVFPALAGARLNGHPDPATAVVLSLSPAG